jgi:uncharacterized protein (DUF952 family)
VTPADPPFFHLATLEQWAEAQATGVVAPPSLQLEGFIHCSTEAQLPGTIDRHFAGVDELVLLRLDPARVADALQWDEVRSGERYAHVYRAVSLDEILEARPWRRPPA